MDTTAALAVHALAIGVIATALLDLWAVLLRRLFGMPSLDWAMVGRWMAHMRQGRFVHERIADSPSVNGERVLGWGLHYATGIVFAATLLAIMGMEWARQPTLLPCMIMGLTTVLFPFLVMQPGLGAGFAASRTPDPRKARGRSLMTHAVFGAGLYAGAWTCSVLLPT